MSQIVFAIMTSKDAGQLRALMHAIGGEPAIRQRLNDVHGAVGAMLVAVFAQTLLEVVKIAHRI